MAAESKIVYMNGHFFQHLSEADYFNDRPEFHRQHEFALWTIYQVLKAGGNTAIITNAGKEIEVEISSETEFKAWVEKIYPGFARQLDQKVYTGHPHPGDKIG